MFPSSIISYLGSREYLSWDFSIDFELRVDEGFENRSGLFALTCGTRSAWSRPCGVAVARGIILDSEAGNGLCNGFFMEDIFCPADAVCMKMSTSSSVRYGLLYSEQAEQTRMEESNDTQPPPGAYANPSDGCSCNVV